MVLVIGFKGRFEIGHFLNYMFVARLGVISTAVKNRSIVYCTIT